MTIHTPRRTAPVRAHAYTLPVVRELVVDPDTRVRSQRQLVALSLLRCPDGSARD